MDDSDSNSDFQEERQTLGDQLKDSTMIAGQTYKFLPKCKLGEILTRDAVKMELAMFGKPILRDPEFEKLVDFILNGAQKTFAALALSGCAELIDLLYRTEYGDNKFPFCWDGLNVAVKEGLKKSPNTRLWRREKRRRVRSMIDHIVGTWQHHLTVPVFDFGMFEYRLDKDTPLPFLALGGTFVAGGRGGFGDVQERRIHCDHIHIPEDNTLLRNDLPYKELNGVGYYRLAQKQLVTLPQWGPEELKKAAKREAENLKVMNKFPHAHFIKGIAYYIQDEKHFFLFPWAEDGNLEDYWAKADPSLASTQCSAIKQMAGLASGICTLHSHNYRHGDLKPQNILCFRDNDSTDGLRLVIADVGLAKVHEQLTQLRDGVTGTNATSVAYAPPEFTLNFELGNPTTRLYDIWSIGCLLLEFVIWLTEGKEQLQAFRRGLRGGGEVPVPYWTGTGSYPRELRSWVQRSIDSLESNLIPNCPLHRVVGLIKTRLLVIQVRPHTKNQLPKMDAEGNLGPASTTSPSVNVISATTDFAAVGTDEPIYRAEAKEFHEEMSKILKDVDVKSYKAVRIGAKKGRITTPEVQDRLTIRSLQRPSRKDGEVLKTKKPLDVRVKSP